MKDSAYLVVGGDSLIGVELIRALKIRGQRVYSTTRRVSTVGNFRVTLDFERYQEFITPSDVDFIFVVAAATNFERCERDPLARKINVELIPAFVEHQLSLGLSVLFLSTNSVFGGERPWPAEKDPHSSAVPAYSQQKSEAEASMLKAAARLSAEKRFSIVRLTKILGPQTSPIHGWFADWRNGKPIQAYGDLIIAPMSVQFVGNALATLGEKRIPGPLHLSGAENVSYVTVANKLAKAAGVSSSLVLPTTAAEKSIDIAFKPTFGGLGMYRTKYLSGIFPQPLECVVADLIDSRRF